MESIIQFNEGDKPEDKHGCFFCEKEAPYIFGVVDSERQIISNNTPSYVMNSVALCTVHAEAFNSLLSGEHDVNDLITVMKTKKQRRINLRR